MSQSTAMREFTNFEYNQFDARWRYESLRIEIEKTITQLPPGGILWGLVVDFKCLMEVLYGIFLPISENLSQGNDKAVKNHALIDKLQNEWTRVSRLVAAYEISKKQHLAWIDNLVAAAAQDIGVDACQIVVLPDFGEKFSLLTFSYSSNLAILEIPVTALHTPWEWSIIWHEIAGYRAKQLKAENVFSEILEKSKAMRRDNGVNALNDFLQSLPSKKPTSRVSTSVLQKLFGQVGLSDQSISWTERNIQELFEDACSVLAFKEGFLPVFSRILDRRPFQNDQKHPNPQVRKEMARRLLGLQLDTPPVIPETLADLIIQLTVDKLPVAKPDYASKNEFTEVRSIILNAIELYAQKPEAGKEIQDEVINRLNTLHLEAPNQAVQAGEEQRYKLIRDEIEKKINSIIEPLAKYRAILEINFSEMDELVDDHSRENKTGSITIHGDQHFLVHLH